MGKSLFIFWLLLLMTPFSMAFNLFIGVDEMNRTLGISARMDYVINGQINEYSTRFPYRVAENISRIRFTWNSPGRTTRYTLRAMSEHFDVLPVLLLPSEGIVPRTPKHFLVEYRCVGARSGQFQVLLHFKISLRPTLEFTLKQEKICSYMDGRRAFAGGEEGFNGGGGNGGDPSSSEGSSGSLIGQLLQLPLFCQLLVASVLLLFLLCVLLFCCCYCLRVEDPKSAGGQSLAAEVLLNAQQQSQQSSAFRRRSKIGSIYASTRSSIRMRLNGGGGGLRGANRGPNSPKMGVTFGTSPTQQQQNNTVDDQLPPEGHAGGTTNTSLVEASSPFLASSNYGDEQSHQQNCSSFLLNSTFNDPTQMPSTSTAPFPTGGGNNLRVPMAQKSGASLDRILYERPEAQQVDISQALVDLNADRNLFEQAQRPEIEGQFGQIVWANWRQIGATGNRPVVDEVDDEEDDAKEDKALICKTLKPGAGRVQFERFLRNALQFHHLPAHSHLSQVIAAATFGNFNNPESVKDMPLICYAHDGFGLLKIFLQTCRASSHSQEMDQISIAHSIIGGEGTSSVRATGTIENCGQRMATKTPIGTREQQQQEKPRIVVTNTPSSALSTASCETTLRTHDLCSMGIQIVSAIRHLHKFGIIHKDIATRNCLVSRARLPLKIGSERLRLHVQLCDSALSRDFFPENYALPPNGVANPPEEAEPCPVRWMAPELLRNPPLGGAQKSPHAFNSATDIWAFGVLLWELFTCGQQPYFEMHVDEFAQALVYAGLRLSQPYNCPDELYTLMCSCWAEEPEQRPTAAEMDHQLQEFMNRLRKYI